MIRVGDVPLAAVASATVLDLPYATATVLPQSYRILMSVLSKRRVCCPACREAVGNPHNVTSCSIVSFRPSASVIVRRTDLVPTPENVNLSSSAVVLEVPDQQQIPVDDHHLAIG